MRLKNVILHILLFCSAVLYAQSDYVMTWKTEGLKGRVRSVTVFCDSIGLFMTGDIRNGIYRYEYDRKGRMMDAFFSTKNNKQNFIHYQYDGERVKSINREFINTGWGSLPFIHTFVYDENGRLKSRVRTSLESGQQEKVVFTYQMKGNKISTIYEKTPSSQVEYDGKWKKISYYYDDQKTLWKYVYDSRGRHIRTDISYDGKYAGSHFYDYNSRGEIIHFVNTTEREYPSFDFLCNEMFFDYIYDKRGNVVKKYSYYMDGKEGEEQTKEIYDIMRYEIEYY